jgi:hypothetical protein
MELVVVHRPRVLLRRRGYQIAKRLLDLTAVRVARLAHLCSSHCPGFTGTRTFCSASGG